MSENKYKSTGSESGLYDEPGMQGFGGVVGANRNAPPYNPMHAETCAVAEKVDYGPEPGRNPVYGSRGMGEPVSGHVAKTALALGRKKGT